jgi:hypothetical protein
MIFYQNRYFHDVFLMTVSFTKHKCFIFILSSGSSFKFWGIFKIQFFFLIFVITYINYWILVFGKISFPVKCCSICQLWPYRIYNRKSKKSGRSRRSQVCSWPWIRRATTVHQTDATRADWVVASRTCCDRTDVAPWRHATIACSNAAVAAHSHFTTQMWIATLG